MGLRVLAQLTEVVVGVGDLVEHASAAEGIMAGDGGDHAAHIIGGGVAFDGLVDPVPKAVTASSICRPNPS